MTPEEIDKLEAGPELDALVAEKVMGWPPPLEGHSNPEFSTDIAAAWKVVEQLVGYKIQITSHLTLPDTIWTVTLIRSHRYETSWKHQMEELTIETGKSVSLAVCRAAVKAVL